MWAIAPSPLGPYLWLRYGGSKRAITHAVAHPLPRVSDNWYGKALIMARQRTEEFVEKNKYRYFNLTRHHFIAKSQRAYLRNLQAELRKEECILYGDFSENYSFMIQDAIQGFHWDTAQATVHPFVAYMRHKDDDEVVARPFTSSATAFVIKWIQFTLFRKRRLKFWRRNMPR